MWDSIIKSALALTYKEVRIRYFGSLLGPFWHFLYPFAFFLPTAVIFFVFIRHQPQLQQLYPFYVLFGMIHWVFFAQTIRGVLSNSIQNRSLFHSLRLSPLSVVLSVSLTALMDYLIQITFFGIVVGFVSQWSITPVQITQYVLLLSAQILLQVCLSLAAMMLNAFLRDIQTLLDVFLQVGLYFVPIYYVSDFLPPFLKTLLLLNPLYLLFELYQQTYFAQQIDGQLFFLFYGVLTLWSVVSWYVYTRLRSNFVEYL
jgi:ABC-type polysaccharide/polyol phosphate export permease